MRVESWEDLADGEAFDHVVVGSGFGGSVSALRLAEKGYRVAVLEVGRHYEDQEFAKSTWDLRRWLWLPKLLCEGIQRLSPLRGLLILSGAGVGGGSLVYANTLLEPGDAFYDSAACRAAAPGLRAELAPHYKTAKRMLGVVETPRLGAADEALRATARALGREHTFERAKVGVFFGAPGERVKDPYFEGAGPERAGCTFCGGCMVGCRHNAKNTLTKNYLHLAVRAGARVFQLCRAAALSGDDGEFQVEVRRPGWRRGVKTLRAGSVVCSAGVLGTLGLLMDPRTRLPRLSKRLGLEVRTNSEVLVGSTTRGSTDYAEGLAIGSGFWPDERTHIEAVRYAKGSDTMSLLALPRWRTWFTRPFDAVRVMWPPGWARRSTILLVMQNAEEKLRLSFKRALCARREPGAAAPPTEIACATRALEVFCEKTDGIPQETVHGKLFGFSTTAHILGGAVIGPDAGRGVVDAAGRAHGYKKLLILDGSIVPANLGVNPSLTITALAERAMSEVPKKT